LIGWQTFTAGLKIYFKKHAWGNTRLPDFIGAIQEAIDQSDAEKKQDLHQWSKDWLQTKGSNKITCDYKVEDGKFTIFKIRQEPAKYGDDLCRSQSFNIGLYSKDGALVEMVENVTIDKQEYTDVPQMNGKAKPDAILLNADDWGFGYFIMEEEAIKVFTQSLGNVKSNIDRAVIIGQIGAMMRSIEFPAT